MYISFAKVSLVGRVVVTRVEWFAETQADPEEATEPTEIR